MGRGWVQGFGVDSQAFGVRIPTAPLSIFKFQSGEPFGAIRLISLGNAACPSAPLGKAAEACALTMQTPSPCPVPHPPRNARTTSLPSRFQPLMVAEPYRPDGIALQSLQQCRIVRRIPLSRHPHGNPRTSGLETCRGRLVLVGPLDDFDVPGAFSHFCSSSIALLTSLTCRGFASAPRLPEMVTGLTASGCTKFR